MQIDNKNIASHYNTKVNLGNNDLNQRITDGIIVHHHEGWVTEDELFQAKIHQSDQAWLEKFIYQKEMQLLPNIIENVKNELIQAKNIYDAGCGRGGASIQLAQLFPGQITGISLSVEQINFGKKSLDKLGLSNRVNLLTGDMLNSGQKPLSFDFIISLGSSEHISDLDKLAQEFLRVALPKATLLIYTWVVNYDHPLASYYKNKVDEWYVSDIHSAKQYESSLLNAGWKIHSSESYDKLGARYWEVRQMLKKGSGSEAFMSPGFGDGALGYQLIVAKK